jgi:hypothetical protein
MLTGTHDHSNFVFIYICESNVPASMCACVLLCVCICVFMRMRVCPCLFSLFNMSRSEYISTRTHLFSLHAKTCCLICLTLICLSAYPSIMRRWQDEVLHNDRFKWTDKAIGREHYCRDVLGSAEDDTSYDDDDVYLDIKNKEHDFSTMYITWTFFLTCITSNTAVYVYVGLGIIAVIYGLYRMTVNQGVLRLSRTKSGYSIVA